MNPRNPFGDDHLKTLSEVYRPSRQPFETTFDGIDGVKRLMDQALEAQSIVGRTRAIDLALVTPRGPENRRKSGR